MMIFLKQLIKTRSWQAAWHQVFHSEHEHWQLIQFTDGRDAFYHSKHLITCSKCKLAQVVYRQWPKFNADLNSGYPLADAHRQASEYSSQSTRPEQRKQL